jgi:transposase
MLPVARIAELMQALYGQSMSTGTIMALKAKAAQLLSVPYDQIKQALLGSTVTHADETGLKVNGKLAWLHALATPALTFVAVQARRGREAIDAIGAIAKLGGTLVCDGWSPYKSYPNVNLAQCGAHILRELNAIYQEGNQEWAGHMHNFLVETVHEVNQAKGEALTPARIAELRLAYDTIGASGFETNLPALPSAGTKRVPAQTAAYNMLSRLRREADDILRFTTNPAVPFTNNVAERTMRMIKVKQKVSGGFRTWEGAQNFSIVRSCVDTMRKQGASILEVLKGLFQIARDVGDLQPASV